MKRIKHMLTVILTAATFALLMSSCFGWYDWYDEPGPPPPHRHHHYHHRPYYY
ncbi:MAG: hypothetical protein IJ163_04755 [Bacteroidaceae bacterium]|nr:hypothetical protein [Bacteroidaceae bacterium]